MYLRMQKVYSSFVITRTTDANDKLIEVHRNLEISVSKLTKIEVLIIIILIKSN